MRKWEDVKQEKLGPEAAERVKEKVQDSLEEQYAPTPERALMLAQAMEREAEAAIRHHNRPRGGQQVPFHGDFASAAISACVKIKWWAREIRRCLGDIRAELPDE